MIVKIKKISVLIGLCLLVACNSDAPQPDESDQQPSYTTSAVACDYSNTTANNFEFLSLDSQSNWSCSDAQRRLQANGIPDHNVGQYPNSANPNTIAAQSVDVVFSLSPQETETVTTLGGPAGATGYVLNGVKIDAGTAGTCVDGATQNSQCDLAGNVGNWSIEAIGQNVFDFGTDANNAHVQPGGAYHYHGMPEGFLAKQGANANAMTLIAWAADGFPIYARYGYSDAMSAQSAIKTIEASYEKISESSVSGNRPSVDIYPLGMFSQDWEYVAGSGDLDACNGRFGVTPDFPQGIYHYFATDDYPYFQRCVRGEVTAAAGGMGPPPGGGLPPRP